jgi:hypothetical protein
MGIGIKKIRKNNRINMGMIFNKIKRSWQVITFKVIINNKILNRTQALKSNHKCNNKLFNNNQK